MQTPSLARARRFVFLFAFVAVLACSPLSLVQQDTPATPAAQALATLAPQPTTAPTTATDSVASPTSTRAPTVALTAATKSTATVQPTATAAPKATTGGSSSAGDPATLVKSALDAMTKKAFRGSLKTAQDSMTFEYTPPDSYHITHSTGEYIILG